MEQKGAHITWHQGMVSKQDREQLLRQKGVIIWLTGLSGAGKSTIAVECERKLYQLGHLCYRLDGDNIRHGLNSNLGFSIEDRVENIRRVGEVAKLFMDAGCITLVSFISPYRKDREFARSLVLKEEFIEVYVKCPIKICEERDPKGLYKKVRAGEIPEFTGVNAPYEESEHPEMIIDTSKNSVEQAEDMIIKKLQELKIIQ